jgi:glycosyltransferase involved in cell wall biosynthesis
MRSQLLKSSAVGRFVSVFQRHALYQYGCSQGVFEMQYHVAFLKMANRLFQKGHYTEALKYYRQGLDSYPALHNSLMFNISMCESRISRVVDIPSQTEEPETRHLVFTIVARNYFSYAKVLMESLRCQHPDVTRVVVVADREVGVLQGDNEIFDFEILSVDELGIPHLEDMSLRYDVMEFSTAIKPFAFCHFFEDKRFATVTYLDPDIRLYAPMHEVFCSYLDGAVCVMTPHLTRPYDDSKQPSEHAILMSGTFNCGFVSFSNCEIAIGFVKWWAKKLETLAHSDVGRNLFTDQRWCDFIPSFIEKLKILRHPGYNVAYWNLHERSVQRLGDVLYSNGLPLSFFHFSGINPKNREVISKHQNRFNRGNINLDVRLFDEYSGDLLENGWEKYRALPFMFGDQCPDVGLPSPVRRLYASQNLTALSLHPPSLNQYVIDLCNSRANVRGNPIGGRWVTKLMYQIYMDRADLQRTFALDQQDGIESFIDWFLVSAEREYGLGPGVSSRAFDRSIGNVTVNSLERPDRYDALLFNIRDSREDLTDGFGKDGVEDLRRWGDEALKREYGFIARNHGTCPVVSEIAGSRGVNIIGYLKGEFGLGEHARATVAAFVANQFPVQVENFSFGLTSREFARLDLDDIASGISPRVNLLHINADQMQRAYSGLGDRTFGGRYNIGYWAWELRRAPSQWAYSVDFLDEVWVPSTFIAECFRELTGKPVVVMPECVSIGAFPILSRQEFNLPDDVFVFLFSFDMSSFYHRKNPEAVIAAFLAGYTGKSDVFLVLKVNNGHTNQKGVRQLRELSRNHQNVLIIDEIMSRDRYLALVKCCDCYVSLHRSEGFGRGPAEAMLLGLPTIVTGFSGNLEYADSSCASLVDYQEVEVQEGQYPFHAGNTWAEINLDSATAAMRKIVDDFDYRKMLGRVGQRRIQEVLSPAATGSRYIERLSAVGLA